MTRVIKRIERKQVDDWEFVVGFDHAAYGAITPDGELLVFIGWWQSSRVSRSHMDVLRALADDEYSGRPEFVDDHLVVTTQSSEVPAVVPGRLYEFDRPRTEAAHGMVHA